MWAWIASAIAAIWKVLEPYVGPILTALFGAKLQQGIDAQQDLERIHDADEAVAAARGWSPADRLRYLERRGRMRDLS